jgi:hypothetical protein
MRFTIIALALLVAFTATTALGEEFPYVPGTEIAPGSGPVLQDQIQPQPLLTRDPVWKGLERLNQQERLNAEIELVLEKNASHEALQMARRIESTWNSGNFKEALALFRSLGDLTNIDEVAIGNTWRTPIPTEQTTAWGTDVRIGNRDEIFVTSLDIHRASGNLFAILLYQEGTTYYWSVNFSTDGGATWTETYEWWASYELTTLSASVVTSHCYVGFARGASQDQAFLYQFRVTDGQQENFPSGPSYITVFTTTLPDYLKEVALASNQDFYNNRLYYMILTSTGTVRYFWAYSPDYEVWAEIPTGITDGDRGLDATCNEGYASYFFCISYINVGDSIKVYGKATTWDHLTSYATNHSATDFSAIGAYRDTITTAFDYWNGSNLQCRYLVTYDGGPTWYWGDVGDDPNTIAESPDIAARAGGGVGIIYRFYTSPREGRYVWRPYGGGWSAPETYNDHELYYNKPSIEQLGDDVFGVVYLTWNTPQVRAAYFDVNAVEAPVTMECEALTPVFCRGKNFYFKVTVDNPTGGNVSGVLTFTGYAGYRCDPANQLIAIPRNRTYTPGTTEEYYFFKVPNAVQPGQYSASVGGTLGGYDVYCCMNLDVDQCSPWKIGDNTAWELVEVDRPEVDLPTVTSLAQNYPNPFNAKTNISFSLAEAGNVSLNVYDITGRLVTTLVDGQMDAGQHVVAWDGSSVSSGVYFYKLTAGDYSATKSMNLLK